MKQCLSLVETSNINLSTKVNHLRGSEATFEKMRHQFFDDSGAIPILKRELHFLKGHVDSAGVEAHGVKFESVCDYIAWSKEHGLPTGILLVGLSVLQMIQAPVVYQDDATQE